MEETKTRTEIAEELIESVGKTGEGLQYQTVELLKNLCMTMAIMCDNASGNNTI